jgi:Domain of unknown function (DUF4160)
VPTLSVFYGIVIRMYFADHAPPHLHAIYGSSEAVIALADGALLRGSLPPRALAMVREWTRVRRGDLLAAWDRCRRHADPGKIEPLE